MRVEATPMKRIPIWGYVAIGLGLTIAVGAVCVAHPPKNHAFDRNVPLDSGCTTDMECEQETGVAYDDLCCDTDEACASDAPKTSCIQPAVCTTDMDCEMRFPQPEAI